MEKNKQVAISLDSPYSPVEWPEISPVDEQSIVHLLCKLLEPLGSYHQHHSKSSERLRSKKRKRSQSDNDHMGAECSVSGPPEISSFITLGFNSTTRHLELLSTFSRPQVLPRTPREQHRVPDKLPEPFSAVFVCKSGLPSALTASLPLLAAAASLAHPQEPPIRLVPLRKEAGERMAKVLSLPRVGFVGVKRDTPGAKMLITQSAEKVSVVEVPWLEESKNTVYLPVKIKQTEREKGHKKLKAARDRKSRPKIK